EYAAAERTAPAHGRVKRIAGAADGDFGGAACHIEFAQRVGTGISSRARECHAALRSQLRRAVAVRRRRWSVSCGVAKATGFVLERSMGCLLTLLVWYPHCGAQVQSRCWPRCNERERLLRSLMRDSRPRISRVRHGLSPSPSCWENAHFSLYRCSGRAN